MPRGVAKEHLPSKLCVVCNRPFNWRKVYERCWDEVQTCSDRCKNERKRQQQREKRAAAAGEQEAPPAGEQLPHQQPEAPPGVLRPSA